MTADRQSLMECRYRKLADDFVQACEDAYDYCEALGDEAPALAWMLAERGHNVGAKFQFALDEAEKLEAVRYAAADLLNSFASTGGIEGYDGFAMAPRGPRERLTKALEEASRV